MTSRYDFMKESEQRDEKTGTCYPDPLTLNYLGFQMSAVPTKDVMTDSKVMFFWKEMYRKYGECAYDDIVLTFYKGIYNTPRQYRWNSISNYFITRL